MSVIHPSLVLIATVLVLYLLPGRLWRWGVVGGPLLALLTVAGIKPGTILSYNFLGYDLLVLKADTLTLVFALIFSIMGVLGVIYALHVKKRGEHAAALLYVAGSLGVVFAGDWLTLFFFWELMSVASVFLIWYRGRRESLAAGFRYLLIHFLSGNLMLFGTLLLISKGNLAITNLTATNGIAFWLILGSVAINAAIPPLHAWLTDAYPEGTVSGSVFLSAFTTKVAVYVLIRVFAGTELLLWAGVIMALYGVVYAVLENNIRRLLAYHIISQVGYMVAAVGMGTDLALNGATAHAFSHILYKSLLFMGTGAVIYATGREKLTELGGIYKAMPLTVILYTVGAFSISGVPLFNGFISKSIVITAAGESGYGIAELLLTLASVGTFLHTGLKLPYFMFFGADRGLKPVKIPLNMHLAMAGGAFLCILFGVFPTLLYKMLPYPMNYVPYTMDHVISSTQLLLATAFGFFLLLAKLGGEPTLTIDTDWFYRKPAAAVFQRLVYILKQTKVRLDAGGNYLFQFVGPYFTNPFLAPRKLLRAIYPAAVDDEFYEGEGALTYDENRYRFPLGINLLVAVIFITFVATLAIVF